MLTITGTRVARGPCTAEYLDIEVEGCRIRALTPPGSARQAPSGRTFDGRGLLLLPGLINAHDHLEFNLFPRLGHGPYPNATAWAREIYRPKEVPVKNHLAVPKPVRLTWGAIKNLLSGVTTVAHHNVWEPEVFTSRFPVRVLETFGWAHSLAFSADAGCRFDQTPRRRPFLIHAAEGADAESRAEIAELDRRGILASNTVLIHGVAIAAAELALLLRRQTSLVWCPSSNLFTLGRTVTPDVLHSRLPIALGTDSAMTAAGDLSDEIRVAAKYLDACRIYEMLTRDAAQILRLRHDEGTLEPGAFADFLLLRDRGESPAESLLSLHPEAVFVNGRLRLLSAEEAHRLSARRVDTMHRIAVASRGTWHTDCDIPSLVAPAVRALGSPIRLAGREVTC